MPSIQPVSTAALAALVWEIDEGAEDVFGANPIDDSGSSSSGDVGAQNGKLARVMSLLRDRIVPSVVASLNTSSVTIVRRTKSYDSATSISSSWVVSTETVDAIISGPSAEALEQGLLSISDYEVLIPANSAAVLDETDAVRIDGKDYDVVRIQHHPHTPPAVAYKYMVKRN